MANVNHRRFGNVRKLPSGAFQARWRGEDGYEHKAPRTFSSRALANDWLAAEQTKRAEGRWIDERTSGLPFSAVAAPWRERRPAAGYRTSTWTRDVEYVERYIAPRWDQVSLDEIEPEEIEDWYVALVSHGGKDGAPLAPATVHKIGQLFSKVLDRAVREKKLLVNPATGIPLPRDPDPAEMQFLTPEKIDELAGLERRVAPGRRQPGPPGLPLPEWWRAFVLTGCYCGLRAGELGALRKRDVDLSRRRIEVAQIVVEVKGKRYVGPPKTKAGHRFVPYPRAAKAEIEARVAAAPYPDDLLFPNTAGDYFGLATFRSRAWALATAEVGLCGFRIHDMRHTAVSLWIASGEDPKTIAKWAGHRSVVTVLDRYGHLFDDDPDPMDGLDKLLAKRRAGDAVVVPIR